ncbi:hypothetical protein AKJ16_DCAP09829 [Drosera capensis]
MGSLESGVSMKKDQNLGRVSSFSSSRIERSQKPRTRFPRFWLPKRLGYLQWICTIVVFSLFLVVFEAFLPGSVVERQEHAKGKWEFGGFGDLSYLKEIVGFEFGEGLRVKPSRVLAKLQKESRERNVSSWFERGVRFGYRKPQIALVFADLEVDRYQILMATVGAALVEIGYAIEVLSLKDGPSRPVWRRMDVPVTIIQPNDHPGLFVDWLNYDGILVNSLEAKVFLSGLAQEPFKPLPVIWTIHEKPLASHVTHFSLNGKAEITNNWKKSFSRASVVVFPDYALPMIYSPFDAGNYHVVPGAPTEACEADSLVLSEESTLRNNIGIRHEDLTIAVVGSQFSYKGMWLDHALVLRALTPLLTEFSSETNASSRLKIFVLAGDKNSNYTVAVEAISNSLRYPKDVIKNVGGDELEDDILRLASIVVYASLLEEESFPNILAKSMCFGKLVITPNLRMIQKYVDDRVNGYLFPKDDLNALTMIVSEVVSANQLSPLARNVALIGKQTGRNLLVSEAVEGYASLLEGILVFPSEVAPPKSVAEIPSKNKREWLWIIFKNISSSARRNRTSLSSISLDQIQDHENNGGIEKTDAVPAGDEAFVYSIWEEEKEIQTINMRKKREEEELKDRSDQPRGTWEDVYRNAKRVDRLKNDLHERGDGEIERTGQPLCIYEPYYGDGTWPFLHMTSLYRGIALGTRGRRPAVDDFDASSRLPLLSDSYYRDILGEFGAFFAVAYRIDRVHKNSWIGFQSWRLTARKAALSKTAEQSLVDAIQARKHEDALYFWMRMDSDLRNPLKQDFWSFCDAVNAGNCRSAFSDSFKKMYGIKHDEDALPPMPVDEGTWSTMHSWALSTRSFQEFVMFSRMFVDAMDAQMYDEHHRTGHCCLSLYKDKHCYSRVLELLINVWAYHSARKMVYVDPESGSMQEQHSLKSRRGQMWVKWFSFATLKSMDEDLAEEADSDHPKRWLWPLTGEVVWDGVLEKERNLRHQQREKRKKESRAKTERIKRRNHQKVIGKYVKPLPEEKEKGNTGGATAGR